MLARKLLGLSPSPSIRVGKPGNTPNDFLVDPTADYSQHSHISSQSHSMSVSYSCSDTLSTFVDLSVVELLSESERGSVYLCRRTKDENELVVLRDTCEQDAGCQSIHFVQFWGDRGCSFLPKMRLRRHRGQYFEEYEYIQFTKGRHVSLHDFIFHQKRNDRRRSSFEHTMYPAINGVAPIRSSSPSSVSSIIHHARIDSSSYCSSSFFLSSSISPRSPCDPQVPDEKMIGSTTTKPLPRKHIDQILMYLYDAARGLHSMHEQHWFHLDMSLDNIVLTEDGHAKIIDFEASINTVEDWTDPNTLRGPFKLHYLAPEMYSRKRRKIATLINVRDCDIWSFGNAVFVAIFERFPFDGTRDRANQERLDCLFEEGFDIFFDTFFHDLIPLLDSIEHLRDFLTQVFVVYGKKTKKNQDSKNTFIPDCTKKKKKKKQKRRISFDKIIEHPLFISIASGSSPS